MDESTDCSKQKLLAIIVRYIDEQTGKIHSEMWEVPQVFLPNAEASCGAERIFNCVTQSFQASNIPLENIIACCTDGASVMVGAVTGFKARMREVLPHILWVQCPAHKTHLCATHAMELLPKSIPTLINNFHSMVGSANRAKDFENLQKKLGLPVHTIPRFIAVRWLSLVQCVDRNLEQWPALLQFSKNLAEKGDKLGRSIYNEMKKPDTICYFFLLQKQLGELNKLNLFLQRSDAIIPEVADRVDSTFKNIASCILKRNYVKFTPASKIDISNHRQYLSYSDFEVGESFRLYSIKNRKYLKTFYKDTLNFTIALCLEMQIFFNSFDDEIFSSFNKFKSQVCFKQVVSQ